MLPCKGQSPAINQWLFAAFIVFLSLSSSAQVFTVDTIMRNGNRANRINFVYLADGYQSSELSGFVANSTTINNTLFSQSPFAEYKTFFNSFSVEVPSTQSGAKHPHTAPDCPPVASQPTESPTNFFGSTFDFSSIHRLLTPTNNAGIHNVLISNLPDYDQAVVVVNSPYYGGSGGTWATASTDPSSAEVAIHEIGHSFANLADEYWAGTQFASEKPNMTANNNAATIKWKSWLNTNGIGIYAYGSTAPSSNWYRPHQNCKMQALGNPFCSVCTERFIDRIHQLVNMADDYLPTTNAFTLSGATPVDFSVTSLQSSQNTITINWYLNGSSTPFASGPSNVSVPASSFVNSTNTVRAEIVDNTTLSKSYLPGVGYVNSVSWTVSNPVVLPVRLTSFTGRIENNVSKLAWTVAAIDDLKNFELEKSADGFQFSTLAVINGEAQKTTYQFSDNNLPAPFAYYRLKIIEKSGAAFYSNVLKLQNSLDQFSYKVYQQPGSNFYHLAVRLTNSAPVWMQISNATGQRIFSKDFGRVTTNLEYDFSLAGKPAGVYFLTLNIDNKTYPVQLLAR